MTTQIPPSLLTAPPVLTKYYKSPDQTITLGSAINLTHGLGQVPKLITTTLKCVVADNQYSVGDEVQFSHWTPQGGSDSASRGFGLVRTSTQISVLVSTSNPLVIQKTSFGYNTIVTSSWRLIVEAWA